MALPLRQSTTRALSCIVGANALSVSGQMPAATTQIREKSHDSGNLIPNLPVYTSINQIKYDKFVDQLRQVNEPDCKYRQKEVHKALKSTIIEIVGKEEFQRMKGGPSSETGGGGTFRTEWKRLMKEEMGYWQKEKAESKRRGTSDIEVESSCSGGLFGELPR